MNSRTYKRLFLLSALTFLVGSLGHPAFANEGQIKKQMYETEKVAIEEMAAKNYKGAAETYLQVLELANQLSDKNDEMLKQTFKSIEANLAIVDNRLETKSDMPLKEKVLRAKLPLVDRIYGKNSLSYQVGIKKLMFTLSQQGKTDELAKLDKELNKDTSGPAPGQPGKIIGSPNAVNKP